jgi:5-(carboxyamino)imidazole ribonucleotide synthase
VADPLIPPGKTIGILGGGQLGRMLALAAARLGYHCHIYAPEADSPAFEVSAAHTIASYSDETALRHFAANVDVVTYEFENVPARTVEVLAQRVAVRPGAKALAICQDRMAEKRLARDLGAQTADFASVDSEAELVVRIAEIGLPAILKTRRFGYDGKGQVRIKAAFEAPSAFAALRSQPSILESVVPFTREVSVVAARGLDSSFRAFSVTENEHANHILKRSVAPANLHPVTARKATEIARQIGDKLEYIGVFAVEFFITGEGGSEALYVNEIAPRVHNSGHWTLDGADTSQFEQHIRAVTGLPLGSVAQRAPQVEMFNLIGAEAAEWAAILAEPGAQLHLYGKTEAREGRKMGHVTRLLRA